MRPDKNFDRNMPMVAEMIEANEPVNPVDLMMAKEILMCARMRLDALPLIVACETCWHYKEGLCGLAEKEPPEEIKAKGCEAWLDITTDPWNMPGHFDLGE